MLDLGKAYDRVNRRFFFYIYRDIRTCTHTQIHKYTNLLMLVWYVWAWGKAEKLDLLLHLYGWDFSILDNRVLTVFVSSSRELGLRGCTWPYSLYCNDGGFWQDNFEGHGGRFSVKLSGGFTVMTISQLLLANDTLFSMVDLLQIRYLQNVILCWGSFGFEGYLS